MRIWLTAYMILKYFPQIHLTPVTAKEIKNIIKSLKMKNSYGYDEIPPRILKNKFSIYYFPTHILM